MLFRNDSGIEAKIGYQTLTSETWVTIANKSLGQTTFQQRSEVKSNSSSSTTAINLEPMVSSDVHSAKGMSKQSAQNDDSLNSTTKPASQS